MHLQGPIKIFAGTNSQPLAEKICAALECELHEVMEIVPENSAQ